MNEQLDVEKQRHFKIKSRRVFLAGLLLKVLHYAVFPVIIGNGIWHFIWSSLVAFLWTALSQKGKIKNII